MPPFPVFMSLHGLCIGQCLRELERHTDLVKNGPGWWRFVQIITPRGAGGISAMDKSLKLRFEAEDYRNDGF